MTIQDIRLHADLMKALLWQYESAEKLTALLRFKQAYVDRISADFWQRWYRDVFHIDTANDFGLAVWARILDVSLGVDVAPSESNKIGFGFGAHKAGFNANFRRNATFTLSLTTEQKRLLVRTRYFNLTNAPTVTNVNAFLQRYFWRGDSKVFLLDSLDMRYVHYVFNFNPDERLRFLLERVDFLPRPAGVGIKYRVITKVLFGFSARRKNFNHGNFGA